MKKLFLILTLCALACCLFAFSVSAASTDEFGTPEISDSINLEGMAEDDDVYCVLFDGTEYHTYPSRYIVTNNTTMTWKFDYINAAFSKEYKAASIVRIQIPSHIKVMPCITDKYFSWKNVTALKEVSFPEDTIVEEFAGAAFEKCSALEFFVVPNTVKKVGHNTFNGCSSLTSFVFEEGSQVTSLPDFFLGNTLSLTEIVLPHSITSIGRAAFGGHGGNLSKLVLSPNLSKVTGNALLNALGRSNDEFIEVYMPACFATAEGSLASGSIIGRNDSNDLKKYVIYYTGTKEEAIVFVTKYSGDICLNNANIVAYDPSKSNGTDYLGMDPYTTDITVNTNRVIVYGYNLCDAFYNGVHAEGTVINSCQFGCGRNCGQASLLENPQHNLSKVTVFGENGYFDTVCVKESCSVCETVTVNENVSPLFVNYGYSCTEFAIDGSYSMSQFFGINKQSLEKYTALTGNAFEYGFVVSSVSDPLSEENRDLITKGKTYITKQNQFAHDYIAIAVIGFTKATLDKDLAFCVYVKDGAQTYYLDNGKTLESIELKSYNDISSK